MDAQTSLCPECGWSGAQSKSNEDEDGYACPVCGTGIEVPD
ncbi:hypothetical protein [Halorussus salilacus]|nr:hypothetical protein [Halorussus salilacus]